MAYITLANAKRIIYNSNIQKLDLKGELYKIPIYFFSNYEKNSLLAFQELLSDPESYFKDIYIPYKPIDTYHYIYEEQQHPAYHVDSDCERIYSDYHNFEVPIEIRNRGKAAVIEFRNWFETVKYLLEEDPKTFFKKMEIRFNVKRTPEEVVIKNSGIIEVNNYSIDDLQTKIDNLIKAAGRFYYKNSKNTAILKRFSKLTFLAKKADPIYDNNTGYSDKEVKELLINYNEEYKKPLKALLIEYYRLKLNPDINMDGTFLEVLGFRPCSRCSGKSFGYNHMHMDEYSEEFINTIPEQVKNLESVMY